MPAGLSRRAGIFPGVLPPEEVCGNWNYRFLRTGQPIVFNQRDLARLALPVRASPGQAVPGGRRASLRCCRGYPMGSPTFGKWTSVLLSAETLNQIYVPAGFAHGFVVVSEVVQFVYKCSDFYDPKDERSIIWNDPALNISWGIDDPVLSPRDAASPRLADLPKAMLPRY